MILSEKVWKLHRWQDGRRSQGFRRVLDLAGVFCLDVDIGVDGFFFFGWEGEFYILCF